MGVKDASSRAFELLIIINNLARLWMSGHRLELVRSTNLEFDMDSSPVNNSFLVTMAAEFGRGRLVIHRCFSIFATPIMSPGIQDSPI